MPQSSSLIAPSNPGGALLDSLSAYRYVWPTASIADDENWSYEKANRRYYRRMPETAESVAADSRWPSLFPSPMSIVTTTDGRRVAMEKEVGASIVNRFPYVVALSFCRKPLSSRHHPRATFCDVLESGGVAALQFLPPGQDLDRVMDSIAALPDAECTARIERSGLATRESVTNPSPTFLSAYLVYEAKLAQPQSDFEGNSIFEKPWIDVGSHRIYFLEITAIQLRRDIAMGNTQIRWRALPTWQPKYRASSVVKPSSRLNGASYEKGYDPNYSFPTANTIAFEFDEVRDGMAIKHLPPLPKDQVEVDNDRARWPCFFPSSCGLITTWVDDGVPNLMPCGSTTIVSRHPLIIAPCVSYASINERYAARLSLDVIRRTKRFGCGVPYIDDHIVDAMKYAGNHSFSKDPDKVKHAGLDIQSSDYGPLLCDVPIHFDCEVVGEVRLGTHIMFLGEVRGIYVRDDVSPDNPLEWCPWAGVEEVSPTT
jgi:flavin reductase (DIM6/NTAB) family NADH-FMN oxidoreductase RutF